MFSQLTTDTTLSTCEPLFRIVDFFAAAETISTGRIMFSRADTFQDKNEGVERLLSQIEHAGNSRGCYMGWSDKESAEITHENFKQSHYISCWSKSCDSVAMWSLYSNDLSSVRISTSISKLQLVAENLISKYSINKLERQDINRNIALCAEAHITPVTYRPLVELLSKTSRRLKAYRRLEHRYINEGKTFPTLHTDIPANYYKRKMQRRIITSARSCSLKDHSFEHEKEVRVTIRLGETKCDARLLELKASIGISDEHNDDVKSILSCLSNIKTVHIPEKEYIECPNNLIETVAIDPRCPPHKEAFMRRWFEEHGIAVVKSHCFGYLPTLFDVYPSR